MLRDANNISTQSPSTVRSVPSLRIDILWVIVVLAGFAVFVALTLSPPNDFWWHLKAGQLIAESGIPTTNIFAWTLPADRPYVYGAWLGEWLFYALYRFGGLGLVVLARNLLAPAALALIALEARRRTRSWRLAALAVLLVAAMSIDNLIIRTQNWSWIPFALYVYVLGAYTGKRVHRRALLVLPLVMVFWVNAHGAFILGLALLALVAAGETLRVLLNHTGAMTHKRLVGLYAAAGATLAATVINPLGFGIFGYVARLLTDPSSQGLIMEWQAPSTHTITGAVFYASILALLAAFAYARRKPTLTDVLIVCAFLWLAWGGLRYVIWFGMVAMPILAQSLAPQPITGRPVVRPASSLANLLLAVVLAAMVVVVQPPLINNLPLGGVFAAKLAPLPDAPFAFSAATPVAATEYLRAHPQPNERLFNEMGYGSYLIWAVAPETPVFIDTRVELYPLEQWNDYIDITKGRNVDALLIDKYDITRVMLDRELQKDLATALEHDTRWMLEYRDEKTEIYRRNNA